MRVASLLPSATELVCVLGHDAQRELVGISHECDFPDGLAGLPILTTARLAPVRTSRAIDRDVRDLIDNALAVYEIEIDRLEAARPDVIVTQDLCDVCAVSLDDVNSAVARLARKDVRIVNLHPMRIADIWQDVLRVADALGRSDAGARVVAELGARVDAIAARARTVRERPRVLSIEWIDPVMVGGLWMPELITLAGGEPLVTKPGEHAPTLDRATLALLDPDVVVVKPCGFSLARTLEELPALRETLPWEEWRAVRNGQIFIADGNAYFNRPGPRIVESLEVLAACTHPLAFPEFRKKHASSVVRIDAEQRPHAFDAASCV